jgi:NADH pyrophosphatase NudC (nudix superfamily)
MEAEQAAELAGADRAVDVRMIAGTLSLAEAATAGYGRGLLHWHRSQRFCGTCGAATESAWGGHQQLRQRRLRTAALPEDRACGDHDRADRA